MSLGVYNGAGAGITKLLLHLEGSSADSSGNSNNGTDTNITYVNGRYGQCASFNGSSSKIVTGTTGLPTGTASRTLSFWVYKTTTSNSVAYGYGTNLANNSTYGIYIDNARIFFWGFNDDYNTGTDITLNKWENIIVTYNGTSVAVYLNGNLVSSHNKTLATQNTYSVVGAYGFGGATGSVITGLIDEVIIENRAWSAEEVKKYYSYAMGRFATL